jgi:hypothetical protein
MRKRVTPMPDQASHGRERNRVRVPRSRCRRGTARFAAALPRESRQLGSRSHRRPRRHSRSRRSLGRRLNSVGLTVVGEAPMGALPASVRVRKWAVCWPGWVWWPWSGAWPSLLPGPDRCQFVRAAATGQGARSARAAAPQAPLTRPVVSRQWRPGTGSPGDGAGCGSVVQAGGLSVRVISSSGGRGGARSSQPYLGPRGAGVAPAT